MGIELPTWTEYDHNRYAVCKDLAKDLGVSKQTIYVQLRKFGLEPVALTALTANQNPTRIYSRAAFEQAWSDLGLFLAEDGTESKDNTLTDFQGRPMEVEDPSHVIDSEQIAALFQKEFLSAEVPALTRGFLLQVLKLCNVHPIGRLHNKKTFAFDLGDVEWLIEHIKKIRAAQEQAS